MRNKAGFALMILGAALITSALLLFLHNRTDDDNAGAEAAAMLVQIQQTIPEETDIPAKLTIEMVNGYNYIGYISIPALGLELPVLADWSENLLKVAPCRHFGSPEENNLVIAAHNYRNHFKYIGKLETDDIITFTDMNGGKNTYSVVSVTKVIPTDVESVQDDACDLVLYTCTYGSEKRIVVGCKRVEE